jgi:ABC-type uncharacterized transport system substrate-binding protein
MVIVSRPTPESALLLTGFSQSAHFRYTLIQLNRSTETAQPLAARLLRSAPRIIVSVGSDAAELIKPLQWRTPVVYTLADFPDSSLPANNSLILMVPDLSRQLAQIHALLPAVKRLGIIYPPQSLRGEVLPARSQADALGLVLFPTAVGQRAELLAALEKFDHATVDAVWLLPGSVSPDPVSFQRFSIHCEFENMPLIGHSKFQAQNGAALAFEVDYADLGEQTALRVQKQLKEPGAGTVEFPRKLIVYANAETWKRLNLELPPKNAEITWITP